MSSDSTLRSPLSAYLSSRASRTARTLSSYLVNTSRFLTLSARSRLVRGGLPRQHDRSNRRRRSHDQPVQLVHPGSPLGGKLLEHRLLSVGMTPSGKKAGERLILGQHGLTRIVGYRDQSEVIGINQKLSSSLISCGSAETSHKRVCVSSSNLTACTPQTLPDAHHLRRRQSACLSSNPAHGVGEPLKLPPTWPPAYDLS